QKHASHAAEIELPRRSGVVASGNSFLRGSRRWLIAGAGREAKEKRDAPPEKASQRGCQRDNAQHATRCPHFQKQVVRIGYLLPSRGQHVAGVIAAKLAGPDAKPGMIGDHSYRGPPIVEAKSERCGRLVPK